MQEHIEKITASAKPRHSEFRRNNELIISLLHPSIAEVGVAKHYFRFIRGSDLFQVSDFTYSRAPVEKGWQLHLIGTNPIIYSFFSSKAPAYLYC